MSTGAPPAGRARADSGEGRGGPEGVPVRGVPRQRQVASLGRAGPEPFQNSMGPQVAL